MKGRYEANEFANEPTVSYVAHVEAMQKLSIVNIVRAVDYINLLSQFINSENEALDDIDDVLEPLNTVINELRTEETCVHCGGFLHKSDLPQYDYICPDCDENF